MALQWEMVCEDPYVYSAITEPGTIRLIRLQPSQDLEADLKCSLIFKDLEESRQDIVEHYTALFYVWGDSSDTRTISIDGRSLRITSSLHCALRHVRDASRVLDIWADGVCIDQLDNNDRSIQVRQMESIYLSASHTIIFLQPFSCQSESTLKAMSRSNLLDHQPTPSVSEDLVSQLQIHVLSAPWFTRVWVLQELVLSVDPWIQCGETRVRWDSLLLSTRLIDRTSTLTPQWIRVEDLHHIRTTHKVLYAVAKTVQNVDADDLDFFMNILQRQRTIGVTDPRDRIYGHLGLAGRRIRSVIPLDYLKSICQVYQDLALEVITSFGALRILPYVEEIRPEERRPGLPSWVPDWEVPHRIGGPLHKRGGLHSAELSPSDSLKEMLEVPHALVFSGMYVGSIQDFISFEGGVRSSNVHGLKPNMDQAAGFSWAARPESKAVLLRLTRFYREMIKSSLDTIKAKGFEFKPWELTDKYTVKYISLAKEIFSSVIDLSSIKDDFIAVGLANLLRTILLCILECYQVGRAAAVLDSGQICQVPMLARVSDSVCKLDGYHDNFIFSPACDCTVEITTALQKLSLRDSRSKLGHRDSDYSFRRFVTYGPDEWGRGSRMYDFVEEGYIARNPRVTFVII